SAVPVDLNGDGLTDLFARGGPGALNTDADRWRAFINVGGQFSDAGSQPGTQYTHDEYRAARVADWNRDGRPDLLIGQQHSPYIKFWSAFTFNLAGGYWEGTAIEVASPDTGAIVPLDYDGNSVADLL